MDIELDNEDELAQYKHNWSSSIGLFLPTPQGCAKALTKIEPTLHFLMNHFKCGCGVETKMQKADN